MGGYRTNCYGRGLALQGDKTTTGATICSTLPNCTEHGRAVVRVGDPATRCPKCGQPGKIVDGEPKSTWHGVAAAVDRSIVLCGCPPGSNKVIAPAGQWLGSGPSPEQVAQEKYKAMLVARHQEQEAAEKRLTEERDHNRVFAKSCLRGDGCNDAGEEREPHSNFAEMSFYQAIPPADPEFDSEADDEPDGEVVQRAQATRRKKPVEDIPEPKKRSALYKWWNGNHEEMDYQAAKAAAASAANAQMAVEGASVLGLVGGNAITSGTWAVKLGEMATGLGRVAASGPGAPVAAVMIGMMPGRLNDGEQDFIDRIRAEQMREAPTRVRYTWEQDGDGHPVPHGWHTPPGKDRVRVRKMEWDTRRHAYTFTTEEEPGITIIWTPDHSGVNTPSNTGNQARPVLPNPVMVDPLPEDTSTKATTTPAPDEKHFADYILILPIPNIPPIYIYLSKPPVKPLEVGEYNDLASRSRKDGVDIDHIPSQAALREYLINKYGDDIDEKDIKLALKNGVCIAIPHHIHRDYSETYKGKNNKVKRAKDAYDLKAAVDSNFNAEVLGLREEGYTEEQINKAHEDLHRKNRDKGWYD